MKKIPTLFMRNIESDHKVRDEVTPGCEWVLAGEGRATRKWDGTAILVRDGYIFKRYEVKKDGMPPMNFEPAQPKDVNTGKQVGWVPLTGDKSEKYILEAVTTGVPLDGTYELCGPKVNGNHEQLATHQLIPHGIEEPTADPRTFESIRDFLIHCDDDSTIEGIVWWHPDGRRAKIKAKDFGFKRPSERRISA
jgi:hypothetical protein